MIARTAFATVLMVALLLPIMLLLPDARPWIALAGTATGAALVVWALVRPRRL